MSDCIFCSIVAGDAPASFVYRDDVVSAFMDIQPVTPGHLLVVPNSHGAYLADIDEETAAHVMRIGHRMVAAARSSGLRCEGVNLFLADGEAAMQDVFHVHLHVIPRYAGDGFGLVLPPDYTDRPPRSELDANADKIRTQLNGEGT
jgi:histidine triad (HIT) family protein